MQHDPGRNAAEKNQTQRSDVGPAASYRRQAIALALEGRFTDSELCARTALRLQPDDVDMLNALGISLWRQGRSAEAEEVYLRARRIKPDDYRILTNLGLTLAHQGRDRDAEECYRAALAIQPDTFDALMNLGNVLCGQARFDEAMAWLQAALALRPDSADALQNVALHLTRAGRWHEAIAYYTRAVRLRPDSPELHRDFAYALLACGDFERGWAEHEWRLNCQPHRGCLINRTFWNGDDFRDRTILLHFEQGFGDTLQFIRFAPLVKRRGGRVVLLCQAPLLGLLARCEGVDLAWDGSGLEPECHIQAPLLSLPAISSTTLETLPAQVPYLTLDALLVERWRSLLARALGDDLAGGSPGPAEAARARPGRPFLVGVAWQGSPEHDADRWRSFPLAELAPMAELPDVRLISLQVGHGVEQVRTVSGRFPVIELPGGRGRDFSETAAIICLLDLVISPDSAVAHLAGGLGARTWLALGYSAEWRWMAGRQDSPWYPTMRLFRQTEPGGWAEVFRRMADALKPELQRRAGAHDAETA
jgi:tetratricopeptide (TPR) repeat protein